MSNAVPAIQRQQIVKSLPKRPHDSNKAMFGTVAVLGGAAGMVGAALLAGRAALKLGAGCVHVGLLADNAPCVDLLQPELMLHAAADVLRLRNVDVYVVGCGLGTTPAAQKLLYETLKRDAAVVLDADALNLLAANAELRADLRNRTAASVLTPHPGEAARLLATDTKTIQADRVAAVRQLATQLHCSVVLKGADSLCATRDGKLHVNRTGNPGMSTAGMGDVLSGMIAALIAQGMTADNALLLAVHLHGAAGDALAQQQAAIGMTATELTEWARWLLNQWL